MTIFAGAIPDIEARAVTMESFTRNLTVHFSRRDFDHDFGEKATRMQGFRTPVSTGATGMVPKPIHFVYILWR